MDKSQPTVDTLVGEPSFVPPRELTASRATVKLAVTPECAPDAKIPLLDEGQRFYVDTALVCRLGALQFVRAPARAIAWPASARAQGYEVFFYEMPAGRLLARHETNATSYAAPPAPVVAAVRPRCAGATGEFAYLPLED